MAEEFRAMCVFATPLMRAHSWLDEEMHPQISCSDPLRRRRCDICGNACGACMRGAERSIANCVLV
jgi:hypothetical protein